MKVRTLISVIILLLATFVLFAGKKISIDETYGKWVNSDYNEKGQMAKTINNPDGTCELYKKDTDTEPAWIWKYTVTDSWHDRKGNLWVKSTFVTEETGFSGYILSKYSKDGTAWENVWSAADYPAEMSPIAGTHSILYRQ
jgi:hypothetical protein